MGFSNVAVAVGLMMMMVVVIDHPAVVEGTIDCKQVRVSLTNCVDSVKHGTTPPAPCCRGVRSVNSSARTRGDRKQACECLKGLARLVRNINYRYVASLPGKCGVKIQFPINPSTDCNKVT